MTTTHDATGQSQVTWAEQSEAKLKSGLTVFVGPRIPLFWTSGDIIVDPLDTLHLLCIKIHLRV